MHNPKLEELNKIISSYVAAAISKFHEQNKGIRVINVSTESEELNPPGTKYNIRIEAQVTNPNNETDSP